MNTGISLVCLPFAATVVYDLVCPDGYQRVGGQILRPVVTSGSSSIQLSNYACIKEEFLVPVKEGLVYTTLRIFKQEDTIIDFVKSHYPISRKEQLTPAMAQLEDLATVFKMRFDSRGKFFL